MNDTPITPTLGRIVWYRGADGGTRAAIVGQVNGGFNLNLFVFGRTAGDPEQGYQANVTHADPEKEPGCLPSWDWMPYQKDQAKKHAAPLAAGELSPHQQRVVDERRDLDEKLAKLEMFFGTTIFASLDETEKSRLERQERAMCDYSNILRERIAAFQAAASTTV